MSKEEDVTKVMASGAPLGPANTDYQSTWVRTSLFKYTKSNDCLACGIKYGILLLEIIKMVENTLHKWDNPMYSLWSSPLVGRTCL